MLIPVVLFACGDPRDGGCGPECDTGVDVDPADSGGDSASYDSAAVDWPDPECEVARWHLGDVVLEVEDDWAVFCEAGFNAIEGSLVADDVPLAEPCLCQVTGEVRAEVSDDSRVRRTGLRQLRSAGSVRAEGRGDYLESLSAVDTDLTVAFWDTEAAQIPVGSVRELRIEGAETVVELPALTDVEGMWSGAAQLRAPMLVRAWSVEVGPEAVRTELPELSDALAVVLSGGRLHVDSLTSCRSVQVGSLAVELDAPLLSSVDELVFSDSTSALGGSLPALGAVGSLTVQGQNYDSDPTRYIPDMPALASVGELDISYSRASVFESLGSLTTVSGRLRVSLADGDLDGLPLEHVGSLVMRKTHEAGFPPGLTVDDSLTLDGNHGLTSLAGLEQVSQLTSGLAITDNDELTSVEGLASLEGVGGSLHITGNSLLSQAEAEDLAERVQVGGTTTVEDNGEQ
jgi:hypothetical protein